MKFDVVVGNPPYKGRLHLEFLNIVYGLSKRYIVWIHPSGWVFNKSGKTSIYEDTKNLIDKSLISIDLFSFRKYFPIRFHAPGIILFIDKEKNPKDKIIVGDKFKDQRTAEYNSIRDLNVWNETSIVPAIQNKILSYCEERDNFSNHIDREEGNFYIKREIIVGGANETQDNRFDYDFFAVTVKTPKVFNEKPKYWFSFKTKEEAENCLEFLKTPFAMFCVSIRKIDQNMSPYRWKTIPWLDWTKKWDNEKLYQHFNLKDEERNFIDSNMKNFNYYNI